MEVVITKMVVITFWPCYDHDYDPPSCYDPPYDQVITTPHNEHFFLFSYMTDDT